VIELAVGISGEMLAGKTTAARFLERHGFAYTRISEVIDDVLRERGETITRENQQRVGLELHNEKGQQWLCARAIDRIPNEPRQIVIDGLRWPQDASYLRQRFGKRFRQIHIHAPEDLRRERAAASGKERTFQRASNHPVESGIEAIGDLADAVIVNNSDIASLEQKVYEVLEGEP
jgi:dephospho-CoA kinase